VSAVDRLGNVATFWERLPANVGERGGALRRIAGGGERALSGERRDHVDPMGGVLTLGAACGKGRHRSRSSMRGSTAVRARVQFAGDVEFIRFAPRFHVSVEIVWRSCEERVDAGARPGTASASPFTPPCAAMSAEWTLV
jgi:hypothetical protein